MSGYSEYVMTASSSLADMVSSAGSTAADLAGQVASSVSEVCQSVASSTQQRILAYKYEPGAVGCEGGSEEECEYPDTDSPVWLLSRQYSAKYDLEELRELVQSRPWMSYRKDFPAIGSSGLTSDAGWGCMLRCGQMVLAGALLDIRLGRDWRWKEEVQQEEYRHVMDKFRDNKAAQYSIHQISLMGESLDKKPVGTWFGPNTVAQVLRKLCKFDPSNDVSIHVAMDSALIITEVKQSCLQPAGWTPLLLFISLRLGLSDINPVYKSGLKKTFSLPSSLGVIGGSPNHALYLVGVVDDSVLYLDPHSTQSASSCPDSSYHLNRLSGRIDMSLLDPSLALCFLCTTEQEFDNLCIAIQEQLIEGCQTPIFEMMLERPPHLYQRLSEHNDINVTPDDTTGMDYEQLQERKYDSDNEEFEIL